jgi:hypothetical protein
MKSVFTPFLPLKKPSKETVLSDYDSLFKHYKDIEHYTDMLAHIKAKEDLQKKYGLKIVNRSKL